MVVVRWRCAVNSFLPAGVDFGWWGACTLRGSPPRLPPSFVSTPSPWNRRLRHRQLKTMLIWVSYLLAKEIYTSCPCSTVSFPSAPTRGKLRIASIYFPTRSASVWKHGYLDATKQRPPLFTLPSPKKPVKNYVKSGINGLSPPLKHVGPEART